MDTAVYLFTRNRHTEAGYSSKSPIFRDMSLRHDELQLM